MFGFKKKGVPGKRTVQLDSSLFKRALAFIADLLILNLVVIIPFRQALLSLVPANLGPQALMEVIQQNPALAVKLNYITFAIGSLMLIYFVVLEQKFGQSPGKMMLNLKVISARQKNNSNNKKKKSQIHLWQNIIRCLFLIPLFPLPLLIIIDPLTMLLTRRNRRLSDIISFTRVVEEVAV